MSGPSIAAEVDAALASLAPELGSGAFSITLVRGGTQTNPWDTPGAGETFALTGNVQMYSAREIDGTVIQAHDRKVMVSALGEKPTTADKLRINGEDYAIVAVDEVAPQGFALYYVIQARG
jgi:hypothetical protein